VVTPTGNCKYLFSLNTRPFKKHNFSMRGKNDVTLILHENGELSAATCCRYAWKTTDKSAAFS